MKLLVSSGNMLKFLQGIVAVTEGNYLDVTVSNKRLYLHHNGFEQGEMDVEANGDCSTEIEAGTFLKLIRLLKAINDSPILLQLNSGSGYIQVDNILL